MFLSKKLQDYKLYFHLVGWTLPWISVIVAHALNSTGYSFGISYYFIFYFVLFSLFFKKKNKIKFSI